MSIDKHLGKSATGKKNKAYVAPEKVDKSLLVREARSNNRTKFGISDSIFTGYDVWHAYEFSHLSQSGKPFNSIIKIAYPSNSKWIVESKSLKLYLNSYNFDDTYNSPSYWIASDLKELLECEVQVNSFSVDYSNKVSDEFLRYKEISVGDVNFLYSSTKEDPSILVPEIDKYFPVQIFECKSSILRSNCKITHQPDWGDVYVYMRGAARLKEHDFLNYIYSFRRENHFHEECCEMIYKRLWDLFKPDELFVACLYTRRGGIDINPVRASNFTLLNKLSSIFISTQKLTIPTGRQ